MEIVLLILAIFTLLFNIAMAIVLVRLRNNFYNFYLRYLKDNPEDRGLINIR